MRILYLLLCLCLRSRIAPTRLCCSCALMRQQTQNKKKVILRLASG